VSGGKEKRVYAIERTNSGQLSTIQARHHQVPPLIFVPYFYPHRSHLPPRAQGKRPLRHPHSIFQCGCDCLDQYSLQPRAHTVNIPYNFYHTACKLRGWFQGTMPFNLPATLVPFYAIFNPRLLLPSVTVVRVMRSSSCSKHIHRSSLRSATSATLTLPSYEMQATAV
jgi:hypothetical protein